MYLAILNITGYWKETIMKRLALLFGLFLICLQVVACTPKETLPTGGVLFIVSETGFNYKEFMVPRDALIEAGVNITIASTVVGDVTDDILNKHSSQVLIGDVDVDNYDMIILVGGNGMTVYEDNSQLRSLLIEANEKGMCIGAICYAPVLLAKAGVIEGKEVTVFSSQEYIDAITAAGGIYIPEPVVSGNLFTAPSPKEVEEFAQIMLELLGELN